MGVTSLKAGTRPSIVDGLFYPGKPDALAASVDGLLARSPVPEGSRFAVISPHAGYEYAGEVMAAAFRAVARRPVRTAVIIGPVHRDHEDGIFLPESKVFSTPLGDIPVDAEAAEALLASDPLFRRVDIPHLEEHCLELQIPFLARLFPGLSIVPLLVGSNGAKTAASLTRSLRLTFGARAEYTVFVVTANMASYMTGRDVALERAVIEELIERSDWRGVLASAERQQISACGAAGIAAILALAGEGCRCEILARASSLRRDEDPSRVVHYAAVGLDPAAIAG
jgi:hypothetical protein